MSRTGTAISWPKNPYKGLSYYTPQDVALFGGRRTDIRDCARILTREKTKVLLLQGRSGCGKSSFLRAGLIPYLESKVPIFQFLRDFDITKTRALFIRYTDEPLNRLCETLWDWGQEPIPIDVGEAQPLYINTAELLGDAPDRASFVAVNAVSVSNIMAILRKVHALLPKWLVLVVDQGEEILTINRRREGDIARDLFFEFVTAFNTSSLNLKLIIALRSEAFGEFLDAMKERDYDSNQLEWFRLKELSDQELVEAIKIPTSRTIPEEYLHGRCQPADEYNFEFSPGLPKQIVDDLTNSRNKQGGILPIMQIACGRLYDKVKGGKDAPRLKYHRIITADDYGSIGDLESQINLYVDECIEYKINAELPSLSQTARDEEVAVWKDILNELVSVEEDGRSLTTIVSEEDIKNIAQRLGCKVDAGKMVAYLADEDQRILREDPRSLPEAPAHGDATARYYSLGHDAVAVALSKWRDTRGLVLGRRGFMRRVVLSVTMLTIAGLFIGAAAVFIGLVGKPTEWSGFLIIGGLLAAAGGLFGARTQISESLARRLVNSASFRGLFTPSSPTQHVIRRMQASFDAGRVPEPSIQERELLKGREELLRAKPRRITRRPIGRSAPSPATRARSWTSLPNTSRKLQQPQTRVGCSEPNTCITEAFSWANCSETTRRLPPTTG
jgi:hypothetical protein